MQYHADHRTSEYLAQLKDTALMLTMERSVFDGLEMDTPEGDILALEWLAGQAGEDPESLGVMVEVGSWVGRTAQALLRGAPASTLYCVDTWEGTPSDACGDLARKYGPEHVFRTFCKNMHDVLYTAVMPLRGPSALWAKNFSLKADLVFLDGDHTYRGCMDDLTAWSKKVRKGGILCGHDYHGFEGVTLAVNEFAARQNKQVEKAGHCVWILRY